MDNPFSGPSLPEPRKSVFGHLANFLLLFPNRALSKDSWNKGPCSLSRRFLLEPKRMPEPGPCFQETNRTATPRLYCEGAVMMLSNTHMHNQSLLPFGKPSVAIPACDFHVTQICAMVFTPHFTNRETGAPKRFRIINQAHLPISTSQGLLSVFIFTLKNRKCVQNEEVFLPLLVSQHLILWEGITVISCLGIP